MTLIDTIRDRLKVAMKEQIAPVAGVSFSEKGILRVALGELQQAKERLAVGKEFPDEDGHKIINKLIQGNREAMAEMDRAMETAENKAPFQLKKDAMTFEIGVLETLVPKQMTEKELRAFIDEQPIEDALRAAKSDGQAVGMVMKAVKTSKQTASGDTVMLVVKALRKNEK